MATMLGMSQAQSRSMLHLDLGPIINQVQIKNLKLSLLNKFSYLFVIFMIRRILKRKH